MKPLIVPITTLICSFYQITVHVPHDVFRDIVSWRVCGNRIMMGLWEIMSWGLCGILYHEEFVEHVCTMGCFVEDTNEPIEIFVGYDSALVSHQNLCRECRSHSWVLYRSWPSGGQCIVSLSAIGARRDSCIRNLKRTEKSRNQQKSHFLYLILIKLVWKYI